MKFDTELAKLLQAPSSRYQPVPLAEAVRAFHRTLVKGKKRATVDLDLADDLTRLYLAALLDHAQVSDEDDEDD